MFFIRLPQDLMSSSTLGIRAFTIANHHFHWILSDDKLNKWVRQYYVHRQMINITINWIWPQTLQLGGGATKHWRKVKWSDLPPPFHRFNISFPHFSCCLPSFPTARRTCVWRTDRTGLCTRWDPRLTSPSWIHDSPQIASSLSTPERGEVVRNPSMMPTVHRP